MNLSERIGSTVGVLAVVAGIFGGGFLLGDTTNPDVDRALSPSEGERAVWICERVDRVFAVESHGDFRFEAKYEKEGTVRYDLTWRQDSTAIAVEELKGAEFKAWAEQRTQEFDECVATKLIERKVLH